MSWIEVPENEIVGNFNLTNLGIDEAYLNFSSTARIPLWLYEVSANCFKCPYERVDEVGSSGQNRIFKTNYPTKFRLRASGIESYAPEENDNFKFCDLEHHFGEFGVYNWEVSGNPENPICTLTVAAEPVNIYLPLVLAVMFYGVLLSLCYSLKSVRPSSSKKLGQRLRSLDTFRGISIVLMIFVNDRGGDYFFFEHATWDGLHVADLVFPWFLWIMGVCIPIAIQSQLKKGMSRFKIFKSITLRSLKLIGLGVFRNSKWGTEFGDGAVSFRMPGILHRLGLCYFVCASLVLISMHVENKSTVTGVKLKGRNNLKSMIQDITKLWKSWILVLLILLAHCFLTFLLQIDGCPTGYLGPGGLHNNAAVNSSCTGGSAGYLDKQIFGIKHIYQWPTSRTVYNSEAYDPEGFLGTLISIVQVWIGVQAGVTLMVYPKTSSLLNRWGTWAVLTGALGTLLCGGIQNEGWIPVNKNLWSLSFVLVTTSLAFILLSFLYVVIDIKKWWSGSPFYEPGMNSILLYLGSSAFYKSLPWHWRIGRMETHFMKLTETLWGTSLWVIVAIWLHRKKWYWSL